ncbi:hypothetical protein [Erythrobacter sp. JK5]
MAKANDKAEGNNEEAKPKGGMLKMVIVAVLMLGAGAGVPMVHSLPD